MNKQQHHTPKEILVVVWTNTIIQPHTVMIKPTHTSITHITVLAVLKAVAITKYTVFQLPHVINELLFAILQVARFVVIDDVIGGVVQCGEGGEDE